MKKNEFITLFRNYTKNNLSPTKEERDLISKIYEAFQSILNQSCLLIGSYARFTAIRPLHDLDILYIAGQFNPDNIKPQVILDELKNITETKFKNPTKYQIYIPPVQSHSITVLFLENGEEKFSVDIVPAFISGLKNEFDDDIYYVPEIVNLGQYKRKLLYNKFAENNKNELDWWIKSDPRGYIKLATNLNEQNSDFRKTIKLIKRWKHNCKGKCEDFKLKSFHVEQIITSIHQQNPTLEMFGVIFKFFNDIPQNISNPKIRDKADSNKFIDDYLGTLTIKQKEAIIHARDHFLILLENFNSNQSTSDLLKADFYKRVCKEEQYLFDFGIQTLLEDGCGFIINGLVEKKPGFRSYWLSEKRGTVEINRKIEFKIQKNNTSAKGYKWKVKNDNSSPQPRGEITDNQTKNNPEATLYTGNHYVECYAIQNNICIAKSKQDVIIK